jgi:hypothetical protein
MDVEHRVDPDPAGDDRPGRPERLEGVGAVGALEFRGQRLPGRAVEAVVEERDEVVLLSPRHRLVRMLLHRRGD